MTGRQFIGSIVGAGPGPKWGGALAGPNGGWPWCGRMDRVLWVNLILNSLLLSFASKEKIMILYRLAIHFNQSLIANGQHRPVTYRTISIWMHRSI